MRADLPVIRLKPWPDNELGKMKLALRLRGGLEIFFRDLPSILAVSYNHPKSQLSRRLAASLLGSLN